MNRSARVLGIAGIITLVAVAAAASVALGVPPRPTLPVGAVDAPSVRSFVVAVLRLVVTVALWYLLVATAFQLLAGLPRLGRHIRPVADRLTAVGAGLLLRRVLAGTVVAGVALPTAAGASDADETPVMVPVDPETGEAPATDTPDAGAARVPPVEPPTMSRHPASEIPTPTATEPTAPPGGRPSEPPEMRLDAAESPPATTPHPAPMGNAPVPGTDPHSSTPTAPLAGSHTVQRGESFWSIARSVVRSLGGEADDPSEVAPLWQRLVDANADRLVDPSNPDLLHTGQQIEIPSLD